MKKFLSCLLCSLIIVCSIPCNSYAMTFGERVGDVWDTTTTKLNEIGTAVKDALIEDYHHSFAYKVSSTISNLTNTIADGLNPFSEGFVLRPNVSVSPNVRYYNTNMSNDFVFGDYNYTSNVYNSGNTYDFRTLEYVDNSNHYTWNPIYNQYDITNNSYYDVNDYSSYYYEDINNYYAVSNNYTNYTYVVIPKDDPQKVESYTYFYSLSDGSNSFNLTKNDVLGQYFNYNYYQYEQALEDDGLLGIWRFNRSSSNDIDSSVEAVTFSNNYSPGLFDYAVRLDGEGMPSLIFNQTIPSYWLEFWFYNGTNNNFYGSNTAQSWVLCSYWHSPTEDLVWFNGKPSTRGTKGSLVVNATVNEPTKIGTGTYPKASAIVNGLNRPISNNYVVPYDRFYTNDFSLSFSMYKFSEDLFTVNTSSDVRYHMNLLRFNNGSYYTYNVPESSYNFNTSSMTEYRHTFPTTEETRVRFVCANNNGKFNSHFKTFRLDYTLNSTLAYDKAETDLYRTDPITGKDYYNTDHYFTLRSAPTVSNPFSVSSDTYIGNTFYDMSNCYIDDMMLTTTKLHSSGEIWSPSKIEHQTGAIWTYPSSVDAVSGDLAFQTIWDISSVRVGGAKYVYPTEGCVYISLDEDVATKCEIYHDGAYYEINFGVYFNDVWNNGLGYNFNKMSWGDDVPTQTVDINVTVDGLPEYDGTKTFEFVKSIPSILGVLIAFIGSIGILPSAVIGGFGLFVTILITLIGLKLIKK